MEEKVSARSGPLEVLLPKGWPRPKGYANGMAGSGRIVLVAGQIGWDTHGTFAPTFAGQTAQALRNIVAVLAEAGAGPQHIGRLTWYVVDVEEYLSAGPALVSAYREVIGQHYPAMALVQVVRLVERQARVEIEATAIVPVGDASKA